MNANKMTSLAAAQPAHHADTTIEQVEHVEDFDTSILDGLDLSLSFSGLSNLSITSHMSLDVDPAQLPANSSLSLELIDSESFMTGVEPTTELSDSSGRTTPTEDADTSMPMLAPSFEEFEAEIVHILKETEVLALVAQDEMMVDA